MRKLFIKILLFVTFVMPAGSAYGTYASKGHTPGSTLASLFESEGNVDLDVPYVPTPKEVVAEMLKVAGVNRDDVLYDLGCGDGRIVVTAAKEFGVRGVGIDMNPRRIQESRENAEKAGVSEKVRFLEQDLFETDFREASVLTLYLLPSVNLKLRGRILNELKPGTRVVSHDFDMDDWEPDSVSKVGRDTVYYWIVPANVSGSWTYQDGDNAPSTLTLVQKFQKVEGVLVSGASEIPLSDAHLEGDRLTFTVDQGGVVTTFKANARGGLLEGDRITAGQERRSWQAQRDPATVVPLERAEPL